MSAGRQRIWELDALRGFCILCVIVIHFLFDLVYFLGLKIHFSPLYLFVQQYGGVIFVVLSGVCITLGSRSARRGAIVVACGMVITLVTWGMYRLGMADRSIVIWFGVLHLLGVCMLVYPLFRKLPTVGLLGLGLLMVVMGYRFAGLHVESPYLFVFGLTTEDFASGDFFPLLPHLGWYLLGICAGRTFYREKVTRFPGVNADFFLIRFFCFCGRQSLWIYLVHQPVVFGIIQLVALLK